MSEAFYLPFGDRFLSTGLTRGPWDDRFQHGGPPAALVAGALSRWGDDAADFFLARITIELLRPVPIATLSVRIEPRRLGRAVQRLDATLLAGDDVVLTASAIRIRRRAIDLPEASDPTPAWPDPESLPPFSFPFFRNDVGYHKAVDLRIAGGEWGQTPIQIWARPQVSLVADRESTAIERVLILADAQSGMGVPVDPDRFTYLNPDLTVYLERPPGHGWLGFDIRSTAAPIGVGLSQSAIRDWNGVFGRSAQSLVVAVRS